LALAAVLCALEFRRTRNLRWVAAAGVLCGVATLTRNVGIVILVPIVIGVWTVRPRISATALVAPALVLACAAVVIAPWAVRNAVEFGRFAPLTTSAGYTAGGIYNRTSFERDGPAGEWLNPQVVPEYTALFRTRGIDEATVDATLRRETREFALEHPLYVAETSGWNLLRMIELVGGSVVDLDGDAVYDRGIGSEVSAWDRLGLGLAAVLAVTGVVAIVRAGRERGAGRRIAPGPLFMWLVPILIVVTAAPLGGLPRYRLPADPFLLMLAAIGAAWAWDTLAARRSSAG
jgi:4-amino-4-deoxy-L-arabinose transferase-like glycosyltransferase